MWKGKYEWVGSAILLSVLAAAPAWGVSAARMAHLVSQSPETNSLYGFDADVDGDTALVGALDTSHVFRYERGRWVERAILDVSGRQIELEGDTAVIRGNDGIHIYTGSGSTWTRQATLDVHTISGAEDTDLGNLSLDGDTLVIAADHSDAPDDSQTDARERGKAYVFTRSGSSWSLQSVIDVFETFDLRLAADVDGDSIVVAYTGTVDGVDLYERSGGTWEYQLTFATDEPIAQEFSDLVAIDGSTVMAKVVESDLERVFVFTRLAQGWRLTQVLNPQGNQRYAALAMTTSGISDLALDGDVALLADGGHSENGRFAGSTYVFEREDGKWHQQQNILSAGLVGASVQLSGNRAVLGGVTRFGPTPPYLYHLFPGQRPRLFCPGDVNGDGEDDVAMVTPEGNVSVKSLDRRQLSWFPLGADSALADAELVADTDGNGAPELAALEERSGAAELRDLATGGTLGAADFASSITPLDLETLADSTGNGIPELAALVEYPYAVHIRDPMTGQHVRDIDLNLPEYRIARDLDLYPGDGAEELAVIGDNWAGGVDRVDFRDSGTGELRRQLWLGGHGDPSSGARQEQVLITDLNGNGAPEMGILYHTEVQIRDTRTNSVLGHVAFDSRFTPIRLLAIPDKSYNGADELVLMGKRRDGTVQRAAIKDSRTGQNLGRLWFDRNFVPIDLVDCGDINGNGAAELAVLGERGANGLIKVVIKDSRTGGVVSRVWF